MVIGFHASEFGVKVMFFGSSNRCGPWLLATCSKTEKLLRSVFMQWVMELSLSSHSVPRNCDGSRDVSCSRSSLYLDLVSFSLLTPYLFIREILGTQMPLIPWEERPIDSKSC